MSTTLAPSVTTRDPKGLKFMSVVEAAYNKAGMSPEEAQRVNDTPGLADAIDSFIAESRLAGKYKDEEALSNYAYPKKYKGPKPIEEQIRAIAKIFDLDPSHALEFAKNLPVLPEGAEGWFAIPSIDALAAKNFPEVTDPAETYCRAVQLVHVMIAASRNFYNYREGQITKAQLRVATRTAEALAQIAETQKGDILIIAAQFGLRHRGRSVRRAREVFTTNEFGLGAFAVACMLLTHPEREVQLEQLHIDCAGDEFSPGAGGDFGYAPCFDYSDGEVRFSAYWVSSTDADYGSASGFLPQ